MDKTDVDVIAFRLMMKAKWICNKEDEHDWVARAYDRGRLCVGINDYPECPPVYSS